MLNVDQIIGGEGVVNQALLEKFLSPYKENCRYLKQARLQLAAATEPDHDLRLSTQALWRIKGEFAIPESCYIDDTGHFNSVEFNICYNQLFYILIAYLVQQQLLDVMQDWDLETFKRRQLSDFLIVQFSSTFRKQINSNAFQGELAIIKRSVRNHLILLKTACAFYDLTGYAEGEVTIAILNGSAQPA